MFNSYIILNIQSITSSLNKPSEALNETQLDKLNSDLVFFFRMIEE